MEINESLVADNNMSTSEFQNLNKTIAAEEYFYFQDGHIARNPRELLMILPSLAEAVFAYHVNPGKNDIASWLSNVFHANQTAKTLLQTTSKDGILKILSEALSIEEQVSEKTKPGPAGNNAGSASEEKITQDTDQVQGEAIVPETKESTITKEDNREQVKLDTSRIDRIKENLYFEQSEEDATVANPDLIVQFEDLYAQLYSKMVELRKNGFDTDMAELKLMRIKPKIKLFQATNSEKDKSIIEQLIAEARQELNEIIDNSPTKEKLVVNAEIEM